MTTARKMLALSMVGALLVAGVTHQDEPRRREPEPPPPPPEPPTPEEVAEALARQRRWREEQDAAAERRRAEQGAKQRAEALATVNGSRERARRVKQMARKVAKDPSNLVVDVGGGPEVVRFTNEPPPPCGLCHLSDCGCEAMRPLAGTWRVR